jgi:ferredoxin
MCGGCVDVCPEYALKMIPLSEVDLDQESTAKVVESFLGVDLAKREESGAQEELVNSTAMIWEGSRCIRCGLCAKRCPTGAISMEFLEIKQEVALP